MPTHRFNPPVGGFRALVSLLAILLLSRCAQLPGPAPTQPVEPLAHEMRLRAINHWHLQAKAGLRSPDQNGSARLDWQQAADSFQISLSGPLGQGRVELVGGPKGVVLTQPDGPALHATSAEALLYQQTGWKLPVSLLSRWLLGLPAQNTPIENLKRDKNGLLKALKQADWELSYSSYQAVGTVFLPSKIIATHQLDSNQQLRLVIAVYNWQLTPAELNPTTTPTNSP